MDSPSPSPSPQNPYDSLMSRVMAMDLLGYVILSALLWKLGVPWVIAIVASIALGASFGNRAGEQTCLCVSNRMFRGVMVTAAAPSPA